RAEDTRAEDDSSEATRQTKQQQQRGGCSSPPPGIAAGNSFGTINASTGAAGATGLDEREKELIRMKMENLEATKTIVDREHVLHS
ncbi:unnamed protein product, partial [Ectocarpus sp. 12 AP-2014]